MCLASTDLLRHRSDVALGHCLASYSLDFNSGRWRGAVDEAVEATQRAYPGRPIFCYLDKKSFKGSERQALMAYLDGKGLRHTFKEEAIS